MDDTNKMESFSAICVITAIILGLYFTSLHSYLLFHNVIEITTIAIGFTLFILTWNTRKFRTNHFLSILGIGYAFIALIDLIHTLAYKGMDLFPGFDSNLPIQLWIAARSLQTATLCAAPLFVGRKVDDRAVFGVYAVTVSVLVLAVFTGNFPDCFIEGKGLTPFKIGCEYVLTALLLTSIYLLYRKRSHFDDKVFYLIVSSIACTAISEMSFTAYVSLYGFANLIGHFSKLAAFYLIYRAILVTGLRQPFDLIFSELKRERDALRRLHVAIESGSTAVLITDSEQRIVYVNPAVRSLSGYPVEDLLGQSLWMLLDSAGRAENAEQIRTALHSGSTWRSDLFCRRKDGSGFWVDASLSPVPNEQGVITSFVEVMDDVTEKQELHQKLMDLSYHDGLTGVPNRRHFDQQLEHEWKRCVRSNVPLSLIMVDIDFFKFYNDSYGHLQGDECLKQVAACLAGKALRDGDLVARYGGEEFVALLPDTDMAGACAVAGSMRAAVEAMNLAHAGSLAADCVTISLGVASVTPFHQGNPHELISAADRALYTAKSAGRNRVGSELPNNEQE